VTAKKGIHADYDSWAVKRHHQKAKKALWIAFAALSSARRVAYVDVSASSYAWDCFTKCNERNSETAQLGKQRAALQTVGTQSDVHAIAVIESKPAMQACLTEGAYGQRTAKLRNEEVLDIALHPRPRSRRDRIPLVSVA
jgi:hypothetical protein